MRRSTPSLSLHRLDVSTSVIHAACTNSNRISIDFFSQEESFGAEKFSLGKKFTKFMLQLQNNMNSVATTNIPKLFMALDSDMQLLRSTTSDPDQISLHSGLATKLAMFRAYGMKSGKWTWNSDHGMNENHGPPPPPPPHLGLLESECTWTMSAFPTSSNPNSMTTSSLMVEATTTSPATATQSQSTPSQSCSSDLDCSRWICPTGQRISCLASGMGSHSY